jgi:hypothetical protein
VPSLACLLWWSHPCNLLVPTPVKVGSQAENGVWGGWFFEKRCGQLIFGPPESSFSKDNQFRFFLFEGVFSFVDWHAGGPEGPFFPSAGAGLAALSSFPKDTSSCGA